MKPVRVYSPPRHDGVKYPLEIIGLGIGVYRLNRYYYGLLQHAVNIKLHAMAFLNEFGRSVDKKLLSIPADLSCTGEKYDHRVSMTGIIVIIRKVDISV